MWFFKKKDKKIDVSKNLVKIDRHGNKWYSFTNPLQMHIDRELNLRDAEEFWKLNITRDWLIDWVDNVERSLNEGKIGDLGVYIFELKTRLELLASRTAYIQFCAVFYLINDEDPNTLDLNYVKKKADLLNADSELRDFFLTDVCKRYKNLEESTLATLKDYLSKTGKIDKATWEHLSTQTLIATK